MSEGHATVRVETYTIKWIELDEEYGNEDEDGEINLLVSPFVIVELFSVEVYWQRRILLLVVLRDPMINRREILIQRKDYYSMSTSIVVIEDFVALLLMVAVGQYVGDMSVEIQLEEMVLH